MGQALHMSVSQIFNKDGRKYAFVSFTDGNRIAEGKIPDCTILSNHGFAKEEIAQLEDYMGRELSNLKRMAAGIHVMDAFMK